MSSEIFEDDTKRVFKAIFMRALGFPVKDVRKELKIMQNVLVDYMKDSDFKELEQWGKGVYGTISQEKSPLEGDTQTQELVKKFATLGNLKNQEDTPEARVEILDQLLFRASIDPKVVIDQAQMRAIELYLKLHPRTAKKVDNTEEEDDGSAFGDALDDL